MKLSSILNKQLRIARVYGIPVYIDYRWFFVFAAGVWLTAHGFQQGSQRFVAADPVTAWTLGIITTLALFLSIFGHELAHAVAARTEGIETKEIVLHPFGGLARFDKEPDSARAEFRIAIAGPASSFLFGVLAFGGAKVAALGEYRTATEIFYFLGAGNFLLAIFNLLPGYPLDGGRVLRAFLWHRTRRLEDATRIAGLSGQVIAWMLIIYGLYITWRWNAPLMGLWSVIIGLFLRSAAASVIKGGARSRPRTVADAMTAPVSIEPDVLISHFIDHILPLHRQTVMPVARGQRLHGILTLKDLKALPRDKWHQLRARDVMRPVEPGLFTEPLTPLARAEELMRQNGTDALAVINKAGELIGFLQPGRLKHRSGN